MEPVNLSQRTNSSNPPRRRVGNENNNNSNSNSDRSNSHSNSDEIRTYLTNSLENIQFFRARYDDQITEEQRKHLILNELNLVKKEVENKSYETEMKSNWFHIINTISSLLILICSAIIVGIQAASDCVNIPVIVLSAIIFVVEGAHKMFRWGPQGVLYKHGTIQLKRIARQVRDYMYMFHRYNTDQLLALISQLRAQYDDIDVGLYRTSMAGTARYNTGLDIEEGGGNYVPSVPSVPVINHPNTSTPVLVPDRDMDRSPHVHIHISNPNTPNVSSTVLPSPYMPERGNSAPIAIVDKSKNKKLLRSGTPSRLGINNPTTTPLRIPLKRSNSVPDIPKNHIPKVVINEDTEDSP